MNVKVDTNSRRKWIEKSWLWPLSRVFKDICEYVVKQMIAKDVIDGRWPSQQYYFNNRKPPMYKRGSVAYVVDCLQRKATMKNQICFLLVQARDENPLSIDEFFAIDASSYKDGEEKQFTWMVKTLSNETKMLWLWPTMTAVQELRVFDHLIPPFVRQHVLDIRACLERYIGYVRDGENISNTHWNWQVAILDVKNWKTQRVVFVKCKGGFF